MPLDDQSDLAKYGYRQELRRSLGAFSSFAAGFSYISILTGLFQMFYLGYGAGGPAFIWSWPLVLVGQMTVALCFAELAAEFPLSGGVYQWGKLAGSPALGWWTGWIYFGCLIFTLAAVPLALHGTLTQLTPAFQLLPDATANAVALGCLLIVVSTLINVFGLRLLAALNNLGVVCELLGIVTLIGLFLWHAVRGPGDFAFVTLDKGRGAAGGYLGPFLMATGLTASYVMYGYDTAGSLAEETRDPRRRAPRAILQALAAAGVAGLLVLVAALMAAPDLADPRLADVGGGLPLIVQQVLGGGIGRVFLVDVAFAITVCTLAVQAGLVRLLYAMGRDGRLPWSHALARVSPRSGLPLLPAAISGALALVILLGNLGFAKVIEVVTSVAILWANLAYLLVVAAQLARRLQGWRPAPGAFSLGRWGLPVNLVAVGFALAMVVNVGWPRVEVYGEGWYRQYGALLFTGILLALGLLRLATERRTQKPDQRWRALAQPAPLPGRAAEAAPAEV